jgi:hypothetical protein
VKIASATLCETAAKAVGWWLAGSTVYTWPYTGSHTYTDRPSGCFRENATIMINGYVGDIRFNENATGTAAGRATPLCGGTPTRSRPAPHFGALLSF